MKADRGRKKERNTNKKFKINICMYMNKTERGENAQLVRKFQRVYNLEKPRIAQLAGTRHSRVLWNYSVILRSLFVFSFFFFIFNFLKQDRLNKEFKSTIISFSISICIICCSGLLAWEMLCHKNK